MPLLLFIGGLSFISLYSLVISADIAHGRQGSPPIVRSPLLCLGEPSYGSLAKQTMGDVAELLINICILISSFGFAVSCWLEITECIPKILQSLGIDIANSMITELIVAGRLDLFI